MTMKHNKNHIDPEEEIKDKVEEQAAEQGPAAEEPAAEESDAAADALAKAQQQAAGAQDKYLRLAAEFDNFRRRTAKEKLDLVKSAGEDILKGMLPVLDDCERAIKQLEQTEASTFEKEGTALIYNKLLSYLKGCGLEEVDVAGKEFDPDFAEAVAQIPAQDPSQKGKVMEVIQKGYTLGGKVIRFPKVVVGL